MRSMSRFASWRALLCFGALFFCTVPISIWRQQQQQPQRAKWPLLGLITFEKQRHLHEHLHKQHHTHTQTSLHSHDHADHQYHQHEAPHFYDTYKEKPAYRILRRPVNDNDVKVIQCVTHQVTERDEQASQRAMEWAAFLQQNQLQLHETFVTNKATTTTTDNDGGDSSPGDVSLQEVVTTTTTASLQENRRIVPVCFHNPQPFDGLMGWITNLFRSDYLSNRKLQQELNHLNQAYSAESCCNPNKQAWCKTTTQPCSPAGDTTFEFVMAQLDETGQVVVGTVDSTHHPAACITRPAGREYMQLTYGSGSEEFVKRTLHKGDAAVLNVYYMAAYMNDADNSPMLGFSTWPWEAADELELDGVVIDPKTQSGADSFLDRFDEGDTLVHEVGHWLGLFHTFEKGCHDVNDGIFDTPKQAFPSYGCDPANVWDSCPHDEGLDAIHNFMGYNDDVCLYQWTPGQAAAMRANYDAYRKQSPGRSIASPPVFLYDGIPSAPQSVLLHELWIFSLQGLYNYDTGVTCTTNAATGDVDLYMNWNASLQDFLCTSNSPDSSEMCTIVTSDERQIETAAFAMVFGASFASNFTITCTTEGFV